MTSAISTANTTTTIADGAAAEKWTPADSNGVYHEPDPYNDNKLFHNWRCGPTTLAHDSDVINVLLTGYQRFGNIMPLDFLKLYHPGGPTFWPANQGFMPHTEIKTIKLQPGTLIDRFGREDTEYYGYAGLPYSHRSLPPASLNFLAGTSTKTLQDDKYLTGNDHDGYRVYRVLKEIEVMTGTIAPWFHQCGGGDQIITTAEEQIEYWKDGKREMKTVKVTPARWVEKGYLERVKWANIEEFYADVKRRAVEVEGNGKGKSSGVTVMGAAGSVLEEKGLEVPDVLRVKS